MTPDLATFARRWPVIIVAACVAEAAGAGGAAAIRTLTGITGIGPTAGVERILTVGLAIGPGAAILSAWFADRRWSWYEAGVIWMAMLGSLVLGPPLFVAADRVLTAGLGAIWVSVRSGGEIAADPFWALAGALFIAPLEYAIWSRLAPRRIHACWGRIARDARGETSADGRRAKMVRSELIRLRRVTTSETAGLSRAIEAWAIGWLDHPEGIHGPEFATLRTAVVVEATRLFGPAVGQSRQYPPEG